MNTNTKNSIIITGIWLVLFFPVVILNQDLWDGVIISQAFGENNPEIYWNWFTESGWFLAPVLYDVFYYITSQDSFLYILTGFMVTCHLFSTFEIYKLVGLVFSQARKKDAFVGAVVFLVSPLWMVYFSSVFVMHAFSLLIALYCSRKIIESDIKLSLIYMMISFVSFQQSSCGPLIISIIAMHSIANGIFSIKENKKLLLYSVLAFLFFILTRWAFPAHGLYEGYNGISINNLFKPNNYVNFMNFLFNLYPILFAAPVLLFIKGNRKLSVITFMALILFTFMNMMPFILINKSPLFSDLFILTGWRQRQAFTITVFIALLIAYSLSLLTNEKLYKIVVLASLIYLLSVTVASASLKVKLGLLEREMVHEISKYKNELSNCHIIVKIKSTKAGMGLPAFYELNYIFDKALNGSQFATYHGAKVAPLFEKEIHRRKYIQPDTFPSCKRDVIIYSQVESLSVITTFELLFKAVGQNLVTLAVSGND